MIAIKFLLPNLFVCIATVNYKFMEVIISVHLLLFCGLKYSKLLLSL